MNSNKFKEIKNLFDKINKEEGFPCIWENCNDNWLHFDITDTIYNRFLTREIENEFFDILGEYKCVEYSEKFEGIVNENHCWSIYYFSKDDIYIKFLGFHESYDNIEFHTMYEVVPYSKTIIDYKKK